MLTGPMTRNLVEAAKLTLDAMSIPRVVTIGDCTCAEDSDGEQNIFRDSYAVTELPEDLQKALMSEGHVAGCPPTPEAILEAGQLQLARRPQRCAFISRGHENRRGRHQTAA